MSELKHTPGQWKAEQVDMHGEDENRWSILAAHTQGDFFVATIENGSPGDTMATEEANARLIAAAPDLLNCLQDAVRELDAFLQGEEDHPLNKHVKQYRAAIAKATGSLEGA